MMDIDYYIDTVYHNDPLWFTREVEKGNNSIRIAKCYMLKNYLHGTHKVLNRQDTKLKEQEFKVKKLILQNAKTILNFHSTYLLGNPCSLTGSEELIKELQEVYNYGDYNNIDFKLLSKLDTYGDTFEYIYKDDNGNITSKVIDSNVSYPVYADDGTYIAFIEYWTNLEHVSYWNVYYEERVEEWTNEGGEVHLLNEFQNETGLPIHYYSESEWDYREGEGLLENIIPILDEIEDLLSKMGDSIYTLSLNPLLLTLGQSIEGNVSNDAVGFNVAMEQGCDMKYVHSEMDYNSIKYYLDTLLNQLNFCSYLPSILGGSGNIANVSEVSLKLLYQLADCYAMLSEKIMRKGFNERFNIIRKLIGREDNNEYVNVSFNYSRPQNASELLDNIKKQFDMNAISLQTIIEKSPLTTDTIMEMDRLKKGGINQNDSESVSNRNLVIK